MSNKIILGNCIWFGRQLFLQYVLFKLCRFIQNGTCLSLWGVWHVLVIRITNNSLSSNLLWNLGPSFKLRRFFWNNLLGLPFLLRFLYHILNVLSWITKLFNFVNTFDLNEQRQVVLKELSLFLMWKHFKVVWVLVTLKPDHQVISVKIVSFELNWCFH